ncbi:hypothetical protein P2Q00_24235 [Streptomyces coacervatus]|uniref:hypothetical protein n=1 Tax=Streptomyces coacervatus TaxID=647381 RepID=UPI0023DB04FA|nr:hypothetical protein [Streptomyces coacervatus]MDF2268522.1 hypothetical protein [Streptomyces coacervatus]
MTDRQDNQEYTGSRGNALTGTRRANLLVIVEAFVGRARADADAHALDHPHHQ